MDRGQHRQHFYPVNPALRVTEAGIYGNHINNGAAQAALIQPTFDI